MYCTKCGKKLEPNERFCPFCGQIVDDIPEQPPTPSPAPSPEPKFSPAQSPIPDPGKRPMNKKLIVAAAIAVAVLAIIAAVVLLFGGKEKPDDTAESPSPGLSFDPSEEPTESTLPSQPLETAEPSLDPTSEPSDGVPPSQPSETGKPAQNSVSLSGLHIGAWEAEGCTIGDVENGWQAFYVEAVEGNTLRLYLQSILPLDEREAAGRYSVDDTYATVTIENERGTFSFEDPSGSVGAGELILTHEAIHLTVEEVLRMDPSTEWDLTIDADFFPAHINVRTDSGLLSLEKSPYMEEGRIFIPAESLLRAIGISVFQDGELLVGMTKAHALTLEPLGYNFEYYIDTEYNWEYSEQVSLSDGYHFIPIGALADFGLQYSWDAPTKTITISGKITDNDRVSTETVTALKNFTVEDAIQQSQNAGYRVAPEGYKYQYIGGSKQWLIPVSTSEGLRYSVVTYDGLSYKMTEIDF